MSDPTGGDSNSESAFTGLEEVAGPDGSTCIYWDPSQSDTPEDFAHVSSDDTSPHTAKTALSTPEEQRFASLPREHFRNSDGTPNLAQVYALWDGSIHEPSQTDHRRMAAGDNWRARLGLNETMNLRAEANGLPAPPVVRNWSTRESPPTPRCLTPPPSSHLLSHYPDSVSPLHAIAGAYFPLPRDTLLPTRFTVPANQYTVWTVRHLAPPAPARQTNAENFGWPADTDTPEFVTGQSVMMERSYATMGGDDAMQRTTTDQPVRRQWHADVANRMMYHDALRILRKISWSDPGAEIEYEYRKVSLYPTLSSSLVSVTDQVIAQANVNWVSADGLLYLERGVGQPLRIDPGYNCQWDTVNGRINEQAYAALSDDDRDAQARAMAYGWMDETRSRRSR